MAEPSEVVPVPSSSENKLDVEISEGPSPEKRRKIDEDIDQDKLENRLGGILCCAVCLDLPPAAVFQCTNGHLMCAACFTHLLADARLRDEAATCPNCRVEISKTSASRNLAVEKTVSELPSECKFCSKVFPRHSIQHHEEQKCEDRNYKFTQLVVGRDPGPVYLSGLYRFFSGVCWLTLALLRRVYMVSEAPGDDGVMKKRRFRRLTGCCYECIGCPWRGPQHERTAHEAECTHPNKSAGDVVPVLAEKAANAAKEHRIAAHLIELLNYEKITFNDLQLKPYRTEEFVHKLYYESARFAAFSQQWVVKGFVNKNQRDPTQSYEREISYQLILKSKPSGGTALGVQWAALRGPLGDAPLRPRVLEHSFTEAAPDAPPAPLPLAAADTNRLLANKAIHFRLIMFLASK